MLGGFTFPDFSSEMSVDFLGFFVFIVLLSNIFFSIYSVECLNFLLLCISFSTDMTTHYECFVPLTCPLITPGWFCHFCIFNFLF